MKEFTRGKNHTSVVSVTKNLQIAHHATSMRKYTIKANHTTVRSVTKDFFKVDNVLTIKGSTQVKSLFLASFVVRDSLNVRSSQFMKESTRVKSLFSVKTVRNALEMQIRASDTRGCVTLTGSEQTDKFCQIAANSGHFLNNFWKSLHSHIAVVLSFEIFSMLPVWNNSRGRIYNRNLAQDQDQTDIHKEMWADFWLNFWNKFGWSLFLKNNKINIGHLFLATIHIQFTDFLLKKLTKR